MSQEHESGVSEPHADASAAVAELQRQLAAVSNERDQLANERHQLARERDQLRSAATEKAELLRRLDGLSRERDQLSGRVEVLTGERDSHVADRSRLSGELSTAASRAETAEAAFAKVSAELAALSQTDPLLQLWTAVSKLTTQGVAWVRGKIPADSPALPWFDKFIATVTQIGCLVVTNGWAFIKWATPQVTALAQKLVKEAEARLAKK
ncbi:MAG TPA: hypothetical protein VED87_05455 [Methylocystis sp.]|nr:hypothetical protein [Methylocystis sp.]